MHDAWMIQYRARWRLWLGCGQGTRKACEAKIAELTAPKYPNAPSQQNTGLYRLGEGGVLIPAERPAEDAKGKET